MSLYLKNLVTTSQTAILFFLFNFNGKMVHEVMV